MRIFLYSTCGVSIENHEEEKQEIVILKCQVEIDGSSHRYLSCRLNIDIFSFVSRICSLLYEVSKDVIFGKSSAHTHIHTHTHSIRRFFLNIPLMQRIRDRGKNLHIASLRLGVKFHSRSRVATRIRMISHSYRVNSVL